MAKILGIQDNPGLVDKQPGESWANVAQERENNEREYNIIVQKAEKEERLARERAELEAHDDIHYHPDTGKFISPKYDILHAHQLLVSRKEFGLGFSPKNYPNFDKIIAEKAELPALTDIDHPDYKRYEPMRRNIAVVRNYVLDQFFPDGKFNPDDAKDVDRLPLVADIANEVGDALLYGKFWLRRPWTVHVNTDVANVEGSGAAEIYKAVLEVQNGLSLGNLRGFLPGHNNKHWMLPPLVDSPFSPANMAARLPDNAYLTSKEGDEPKEIMDSMRPSIALAAAADTIASNASRLRDVESLDKPVLDESVEHGREILRKLRVQLGAPNQENGMAAPPQGDKVEQSAMIAKLSNLYRDYMSAACVADPSICDNLSVVQGNEAMGKLAYIVKRTLAEDTAASGDMVTARQLAAELEAMPANWKDLRGESMGTLLNKLDRGYEFAAETLARDNRLDGRQQRITAYSRSATHNPLVYSGDVSPEQVKVDEFRQISNKHQANDELLASELIRAQEKIDGMERQDAANQQIMMENERQRIEMLKKAQKAASDLNGALMGMISVEQGTLASLKAPKKAQPDKVASIVSPEEILKQQEEEHNIRR